MMSFDQQSPGQTIGEYGLSVFRQQLVLEEREAAQRVQQAYERLIQPTLARIQALALGASSTAEFSSLLDLQALRAEMAQALAALPQLIQQETAGLEGSAIGLGMQYAQVSTGMVIGWNQPDPAAVRNLINYADSAPMQAALGQYAPYHAQQLADVAVMGISRGWNPRRIASAMRAYVRQMPLSDADRIMRTAQVWSYRQANVEAWRQNSQVVQGWYWRAALDDRSCIGCISQHGTRHSLDEVLNDHHRGRCLMVPIVPGRQLPPENAGQLWFEGLSPHAQQMRMGTGRWLAWQDGAFGFGQLSRPYQDPIYGEMRTHTSLSDLVGEQAAARYHGQARIRLGN